MFEGLPCLACSEEDSVSLRFIDDTFVCSSCDDEKTIDEVDHVLNSWGIVLSWVKTAPKLRKDAGG